MGGFLFMRDCITISNDFIDAFPTYLSCATKARLSLVEKMEGWKKKKRKSRVRRQADMPSPLLFDSREMDKKREAKKRRKWYRIDFDIQQPRFA